MPVRTHIPNIQLQRSQPQQKTADPQRPLKLLTINSSARINGNTSRVADAIEARCRQRAAERQISLEIERINLAEQKIDTCKGCRACLDISEKKCPLIQDDVMQIHAKMLAADLLLIGTPVYLMNMNGILKNWMDRMAFNTHRPSMAGKSAVIYCTTAGARPDFSTPSMKTVLATWGIKVEVVQKYVTGALMSQDTLATRYQRQLDHAAEILLKAGTQQSAAKPTFFGMISFGVQKRAWLKSSVNQNSPDYLYWKGKGWLEDDAYYYFPPQGNPVKNAFARFAAHVVAIPFLRS